VFEHWESGQATVINVMDITGNSSGTTRRHAYVLEAIATDGHETFRDECKDPLIVRDDFLAPRVGEVVTVKIDWDKKKIDLVRDAPERKFNPYANAHTAKNNFKAALAGTDAPASAPGGPYAPRPGAGPTIKIGPNANITIDPNAKITLDPSATLDIDPAAHINAGGSPSAVGGVAAQLASLAALHQQGVLSDTQFEQAKNAVIGLSSKG
jgi:hypothetical protein